MAPSLKNIVIYTCDNMDKDKIFEDVATKFGINVKRSSKESSKESVNSGLNFVNISTVVVPGGESLIDPCSYPRLTMLRQMLGGSNFLSQALKISGSEGHSFPDIFFDTTGCAWTHGVIKGGIFRCFMRMKTAKVFTYTHYPTISTDMLNMVYERRFSYNNSEEISASKIKNAVKVR